MPAAKAIDAPAYLEAARVRVDAYLDRVLPPAGTGAGRLHEAMRYSVFAGGKRLRPALAMASAEAVGGRPEDSVAFAGALELVHTYSLVHDDLPSMDDDDLRRGKPTSHKVFGEAMAILAGDALHSLAFESLLENVSDATLARDLARDLARAAGVRGMVGGQVEDLCAERATPSEERLLKIHGGKTAALIAASCVGGGRCAGASASQLDALSRFGLDLGHAFQIVDDVLDVTGTPEQLGKTPGKDRRGKKMTYVALEGVPSARSRADRRLSAALSSLSSLPHPSALSSLALFVVSRDR